MSGALPSTTASMSFHVMPASSSASCAASRTSPAIETSLRAVRCLVWPTPTTATRSPAMSVTLQNHDHVLLQARAARRVGDTTRGLATLDAFGDFADAGEARAHHAVRRERAARRVDVRRCGIEPECFGEDQLFVGELRVQLGHVDLRLVDPGRECGRLRRLRCREVTHAEAVRLDAM